MNSNYFRIKKYIYAFSAFILLTVSAPFFVRNHVGYGITLLVLSLCYLLTRTSKSDPITTLTFNTYVIIFRLIFALIFIMIAIFVHVLLVQFILIVLTWMNLIDSTIIIAQRNYNARQQQ